jgi:hypothetical protein
MVAAIRYWLIATKVTDNDSITEFGKSFCLHAKFKIWRIQPISATLPFKK